MTTNLGNMMTWINDKIIKSKVVKLLFQLSILFLISVVSYLVLYNRYPVYFTHVNWIYKRGGDAFQHQIGWEFFRNDPWHFPLGDIKSLGYPFGTNIVFTDSIPLLALPLKLLSPLLEQRFQYFGLWEFISLFLQLLSGFFLIGEFSDSFIEKVMGGILFVLSPSLIFRAFEHSSLTAHWIIIIAIWLCVRTYKNKCVPKWAWPLLFSTSLLIHLYFFPMIIPIWILSKIFNFKKTKKILPIIIELVTIICLTLLIGFIIGIFRLDSAELGEWGYGYYSWNGNGFINSMNLSSFLDGIVTGTEGQYEGYSYLGLGVIITSIVGLIFYLERDHLKKHLSFSIPITVVSLVYILFSLSNKAYLNNSLLWEIKIQDNLLSKLSFFRSTGRFVWPVVYIITLFAVASIIRNMKHPAIFLFMVVIIQLIDIQPLYSIRGASKFMEYTSPLTSEFWQDAADNNEFIVLYPANNSAINHYGPLALFAQQNQMKINWSSVARGNKDEMEDYARMEIQHLLSGNMDEEKLYIFFNEEGFNKVEEINHADIMICNIDGYQIALSRKNEMINTSSDWIHSCSIP